jgi:hypothetical protein
LEQIPILSTYPTADALAAIIDLIKGYMDMRRANTIGADKYFHCLANCRGARHGFAGDDTAEFFSEMREVADLWKGDSIQACNADRTANEVGRKGDKNHDCSQVCEAYRPLDLDSKY